jgi:hypothetical protein
MMLLIINNAHMSIYILLSNTTNSISITISISIMLYMIKVQK